MSLATIGTPGRHRLGGDDAEGLAAGVRRAEARRRSAAPGPCPPRRPRRGRRPGRAASLGQLVQLLVGVAWAGDEQPQAGPLRAPRISKAFSSTARPLRGSSIRPRKPIAPPASRPAVQRVRVPVAAVSPPRWGSARRRRRGARRTSSAPPRRPRSGRRSSPARCGAPAGWRAARRDLRIAVCTVATIGPDGHPAGQQRQRRHGRLVHVQHVEVAVARASGGPGRADSGPNASRATDPLYGTGIARPAGTT